MKKTLPAILAAVLIFAGAVSLAEEAADIFMTAMKNNFNAGRMVIDQILSGQFH